MTVFKTALNYFQNKNKLNNKKGDSLKWYLLLR